MHLNHYHGPQTTPEEGVRLLLEDMDRNNVSDAMVLTSYITNTSRPSVERVLELVRPHPRLHVVEGINLGDGAPDLAGTEARLTSGDVIALKLYPGYQHFYPTDAVCEPIYEMAARHKVPVMFHSGDTFTKLGKLKYSHPLHLDEVAVDNPDMKMVVCHLGNPWFRDTAEIIYKNENVRADISGLILGRLEARFERWLADQVRDLLLYAGDPEDLLFGTDWPLVDMAPYLHFVKALDLSEEHEEMLLNGNAREWFDLDHRRRDA